MAMSPPNPPTRNANHQIRVSPSVNDPNARRTFAVLVDGDNAPPDVLRMVLLEVEKRGEARVRLVFGGNESLKGHKEDANSYGFRPVLQYAVATRKNAADIAMAINAIDLLHAGEVDAFCIVSSDSDFQPLATRLREAGRFVLGIGRDATPDALKSACHDFASFEMLSRHGIDVAQPAPKGKGADAKPTVPPLIEPARIASLLQQAYAAAQLDDGWALLSTVGTQLRILEPGFDPRKYGRRQVWRLAQEVGNYEFRPEPPVGPNEQLYIRAKS